MIRVGLEPQSVARFREQVSQAAARKAEGATRPAAKRIANLMHDEFLSTVDSEKIKGGREKLSAKMKADTRLPFRDSVIAKVALEADGWHAFLTVAPGADAAKVRAIERGARADYTITAKNERALTGWNDPETGKQVFTRSVTHKAFPGRFVMRRARDRVYQRVRRGTV